MLGKGSPSMLGLSNSCYGNWKCCSPDGAENDICGVNLGRSGWDWQKIRGTLEKKKMKREISVLNAAYESSASSLKFGLNLWNFYWISSNILYIYTALPSSKYFILILCVRVCVCVFAWPHAVVWTNDREQPNACTKPVSVLMPRPKNSWLGWLSQTMTHTHTLTHTESGSPTAIVSESYFQTDVFTLTNMTNEGKVFISSTTL